MEVIEPVIDNYLLGWLAMGYDADTLEFLANYCFKKNKRSLDGLNEQILSLYDKGLITLSSIAEYVKAIAKTDEFIKCVLNACGLDRKPTGSDRQMIYAWNNWGFNEEMILQAATLSIGKIRPLVYMNTILSDWKSKGIFTKDKVLQNTVAPSASTVSTGSHLINELSYTKEELDALIDSVDDIKF